MKINELLALLESITVGRQFPAEYPGTDVVVRYLDEEFDIDAVRIESFAGNENEPAREVLAIRIELPEGEHAPCDRCGEACCGCYAEEAEAHDESTAS